ncbi:MAG: ABC transporter permease, partial [Propionibacteriales bacterium]|nr:ABC transporter permease [Propionibacteriales bacterium]
MAAYIVRRIAINLLVLWIISLILFTVVQAAPGDPIRMMIPPSELNTGTEEFIAMRRHELGLDRPILVQYVSWLGNAVTGDLGSSFANGRAVSALIYERIGATILLMGLGLLISISIAIPLGVWSAAKKNSAVDYVASVVSLSAVCIPPFFLGMVGIYVLS